jgi:hypothetical protein
VLNTNLASFFFGPTRHREFRETVRAWRRAERDWCRSPLAEQDVELLAETVASEAIGEQRLSPGVAAAIADTIRDLLVLEDVGELEVDWQTIDTDPIEAVRFRQMLARRRRWARDTAGNLTAFSRVVADSVAALLQALPETNIEQQAPGGFIFDVPLVKLIERPAAVIERLAFAPYDNDCLSRGLFSRVRRSTERNLAVASGLPTASNLRDQLSKLVIPTRQKGRSAGELADLYLAGTPWTRLLDTPVPFQVPDHIRYEHAAIIAGTGHGKTQLMQRQIYGDLLAAQREKRSVVVIDSQGDLINRLVRLGLFAPGKPGSLVDRLILIDPADVEFPPALNLFHAHLERLEGYRAADRERVLNGVVELYETFFADLLGAELTQKQGVVFKYLARLMLTIPAATIHTLMRLMEDGRPFKAHMAQLEGSARHFFEYEFFHPAFAQTKRQILRRLWGVMATPSFERMFAQPENKLDMFRALQAGSILFINTAKDLLKTEGSQLFGRFFIQLITQAALERSTIEPAERTPTMIYIDEAQEYFDDTTETILNQARKQKVGLTMAFQALDLMPPRLRAVMLADTSMKCVGGVSARDARALADELHTTPDFIESMRRRGDRTEFAVWLKNLTPHAIPISVPLGFVESQPILTEEAFAELIDANRRRYCGTLAVVLSTNLPHPIRSDGPAEPEGLESTWASAEKPEADTGVRPEIGRWERASRPFPKPVPAPGKGGSQHKYLQQLIKRLAEEHGLRAVLEEAVPGGQVDVGLHQGDLSIACEISVTSTPEYETKNLAKCLGAGFARVWAIAPDAKRRRAIKQAAEARLSPEDAGRVEFLTTEEMVEAFDALTVPEPEEKVVKGYRVKTTRKAISPTEAKERRAHIARILYRSTRDADR